MREAPDVLSLIRLVLKDQRQTILVNKESKNGLIVAMFDKPSAFGETLGPSSISCLLLGQRSHFPNELRHGRGLHHHEDAPNHLPLVTVRAHVHIECAENVAFRPVLDDKRQAEAQETVSPRKAEVRTGIPMNSHPASA